MVDILTFDGFFGAKFDILKPRWLPTAGAIIEQRGPIKLITPFSLRSGSLRVRVSAHRQARGAGCVPPVCGPRAPP